METMQERTRELQKAVDELSQMADARRKETASLTHQLEMVQVSRREKFTIPIVVEGLILTNVEDWLNNDDDDVEVFQTMI